MFPKYSIEITEGICYNCFEKSKKITNYNIVSGYTLNFCNKCENLYKITVLEYENLNKKNEKYYTTYKITNEKEIHYVNIKGYRNIGFQDYVNLIK